VQVADVLRLLSDAAAVPVLRALLRALPERVRMALGRHAEQDHSARLRSVEPDNRSETT
jgi:hypothetical protein